MELKAKNEELFTSHSFTVTSTPFRAVETFNLQYKKEQIKNVDEGVCHRLATKWAALQAVGAPFKYTGMNVEKLIIKQREYGTLSAKAEQEARSKSPDATSKDHIEAFNEATREADLDAIDAWAEKVTDADGEVHSVAVERPIKQSPGMYFPKTMADEEGSYLIGIEYIAKDGRKIGGHTIGVGRNCWFEPVPDKGLNEHIGEHFGQDLERELTEQYLKKDKNCEHLEFFIIPLRPIHYLQNMNPVDKQQLLENLGNIASGEDISFEKIKKREITGDLGDINLKKLSIIGSYKVFEDARDGGTVLLYIPTAKRLIVVPPGEAKRLKFDGNNRVNSITANVRQWIREADNRTEANRILDELKSGSMHTEPAIMGNTYTNALYIGPDPKDGSAKAIAMYGAPPSPPHLYSVPHKLQGGMPKHLNTGDETTFTAQQFDLLKRATHKVTKKF